PLAVRFRVLPTHTGLLLPAVTVGILDIRMSRPLSLDTFAGTVEAIRILYAVPAGVPAGMEQLIVPPVIDASVPIVTGLAKLPDASDNCTVNTLPVPKFCVAP